MKRILIGVVLLSALLIFVIPLMAEQDVISGRCTLPATAGITIEISEYQGGPVLASGTTTSGGLYSIVITSLSSGQFYFYATDGVGTHLWQFTHSGDTSHNFALGV